jgi:ArsR family transcriptional regulator, arsenate/arsenite/antimonite-responsive transcriptional repressor
MICDLVLYTIKVCKKDSLEALAALGQEIRLDVFQLLVRAGRGRHGGWRRRCLPRRSAEHSVGPPQGAFVCGPGPTQKGRQNLRYVADLTGCRELLAYLMEDCCNGSPELRRPVIDAVTGACGD